MKKFEVIAIVFTITMIICIFLFSINASMVLFVFHMLILPFVVLYFISVVETIISLIRKGFKKNKIKVICHALVVLAIAVSNVYSSDIFKSKTVLKARLVDDLFFYTLIFREDGTCETEVDGIFFYKDLIKGRYQMKGDTILFIEKPYDNNFIPDTMLVDRDEKAIFLHRDSVGEFERAKQGLEYFRIIE